MRELMAAYALALLAICLMVAAERFLPVVVPPFLVCLILALGFVVSGFMGAYALAWTGLNLQRLIGG